MYLSNAWLCWKLQLARYRILGWILSGRRWYLCKNNRTQRRCVFVLEMGMKMTNKLYHVFSFRDHNSWLPKHNSCIPHWHTCRSLRRMSSGCQGRASSTLRVQQYHNTAGHPTRSFRINGVLFLLFGSSVQQFDISCGYEIFDWRSNGARPLCC